MNGRYNIIYQAMCFLYHHPLVPTMYPITRPNMDTPMKSHFGTCDAELMYSGLEVRVNVGVTRDLTSCRSTTCQKFDDVAFVWQCVKQIKSGASTHDNTIRLDVHMLATAQMTTKHAYHLEQANELASRIRCAPLLRIEAEAIY